MSVYHSFTTQTEVDLDLTECSQSELLRAYMELVERDGSQIEWPLDSMIDSLRKNGCPEEILALVKDWMAGELSVHDVLLLGAG